MAADLIHLAVPANARYASLVRLAATQLAAQSGFDLDRIEDVRMAISEATRILSGGVGGAPLAADFEVVSGEFTARLSRDMEGSATIHDDRSERILGATTGHYGIDLTGPSATVVVGFLGTLSSEQSLEQSSESSNERED